MCRDRPTRRLAVSCDTSPADVLAARDGVDSVQELVGGTPTANLLTGGIDSVFQRSDGAGSWTVLPGALGSTLGVADSGAYPEAVAIELVIWEVYGPRGTAPQCMQ